VKSHLSTLAFNILDGDEVFIVMVAEAAAHGGRAPSCFCTISAEENEVLTRFCPLMLRESFQKMRRSLSEGQRRSASFWGFRDPSLLLGSAQARVTTVR
jgi:hypothetical protein